MSDLRAATARALTRLTRQAQHDWRCPGLTAGVVRDGRLAWSSHLGWCDVEQRRAADDDTQFLIGSITKTFTAVLVLQLRDEGLVALDDRLDRHLPDLPLGDVTVRALLAHASGLQREFATPVWETLDFPDAGRILAEMSQVERVLPAHLEFHYSNLAYALLGILVERVGGVPFAERLADRVTGPLGLRVTLTPVRPAQGYYTDPYTHEVRREPVVDARGTGPVGGLWASLTDLAGWAAFLAEPDARVLAATTVEQMCRPVVITDLRRWTRGWGLGLALHRVGERVLVGHDGAMPGFLSGLRVDRETGVGAVVLANASAGCDVGVLAQDLVGAVLEAEPPLPELWMPEAVDPALAELTGTWWTEGDEIRFVVEDGSLVAGFPGLAWARTRSRFEPAGEGLFRVAEGRERGERLEVLRDAAGRVERMRFAGYAVTREPLTFAEL